MAEIIKAGVKRPHSMLDEAPRKAAKVHRRVRHVQKKPRDVELASQDPLASQCQLLRSLTAALAVAGFDSVTPTALEMFRAATEEYMLQFLQHVRRSMQGARRRSPTALDFASALALSPNSARASLLKPQLALQLPEAISYPSIPEPDPDLPLPPDFSALLQPLMPRETPSYIPAHFPRLPPQHAWKSTPVLPEREVDARKMREKATEEGLLAEQALRKLAAAAKAGAANAEKKREAALAGQDRARIGERGRGTRRGRGPAPDPEQMFADLLRQVGGKGEDAMELGMDGTSDLREEGVDLDMPDGVVVNYGMSGWRHSGKKALRL